MKFYPLHAIVALVCGVAGLAPANAHYLWIERSGADAAVYFGEYEEAVRERSPGRLDEIPGPRAQAVSGQSTEPLALQKRATGFVVAPTSVASAQALLVEEAAVGVKDWRKSGIGIVKPFFYARHQPMGNSDTGSAAGPSLTLDILPTMDEGRFGVYFRGKPLPKADVKIVAPNTWAQEGRTDDEGMVRLPLPWKGQYILQVIHLERAAGEYMGQPYEARRHRATLTYVATQGEATFSSKSATTP